MYTLHRTDQLYNHLRKLPSAVSYCAPFSPTTLHPQKLKKYGYLIPLLQFQYFSQKVGYDIAVILVDCSVPADNQIAEA